MFLVRRADENRGDKLDRAEIAGYAIDYCNRLAAASRCSRLLLVVIVSGCPSPQPRRSRDVFESCAYLFQTRSHGRDLLLLVRCPISLLVM